MEIILHQRLTNYNHGAMAAQQQQQQQHGGELDCSSFNDRVHADDAAAADEYDDDHDHDHDHDPAASLLMIDRSNPVPAPFLTKTYDLVDDPATDNIVSWATSTCDHHDDDPDAASCCCCCCCAFVVWRPPEFAKDILPNYFKHNNFSSFVRQLNTYGFRKVVPERWEFSNELFRKGQKQLLGGIQRRISRHQLHYMGRRRDTTTTSSFTGLPPDSTAATTYSLENIASDLMLQQYYDHILQYPPPPPPPPAYNIAPDLISGFDNHINHLQHRDRFYTNIDEHLQQLAADALAADHDNERLRRDNTLLLYEINRVRNLYNNAVAAYLQPQQLQAAQSLHPHQSPNVHTRRMSAPSSDHHADQYSAGARGPRRRNSTISTSMLQPSSATSTDDRSTAGPAAIVHQRQIDPVVISSSCGAADYSAHGVTPAANNNNNNMILQQQSSHIQFSNSHISGSHMVSLVQYLHPQLAAHHTAAPAAGTSTNAIVRYHGTAGAIRIAEPSLVDAQSAAQFDQDNTSSVKLFGVHIV